MADGSAIEWTDATWNPVTGCSVVSPGCTNCYAMKLAGGRLASHMSRVGLTKPSKAGPVWTGELRLNRKWLDQPLRWKRPRTIFVAAHGDLFHEDMPEAWIDSVFAVMAMARQHRFQVLTKRAERMRDYLADREAVIDRWERRIDLRWEGKLVGTPWAHTKGEVWPLRNVWLGVSVEDQQRADERIPALLDTAAAIRFLSVEPLLGPVALIGLRAVGAGEKVIHWVIVGGESGPDARPMHPTWARSIRDQCAAAGVPFFLKQWGAWVWSPDDMNYAEGETWAWVKYGRTGKDSVVAHSSGHTAVRVGKKLAGRELDGRTWDEMPA